MATESNALPCGHERTPENVYRRTSWDRIGHERCRTCTNEQRRESRARRRAEDPVRARELNRASKARERAAQRLRDRKPQETRYPIATGSWRPSEWVQDAACAGADTELFFPDKRAPRLEDYAYALQMCRGCPVAAQCLEYAVNTQQAWGVWGGTTPGQRGWGSLKLERR